MSADRRPRIAVVVFPGSNDDRDAAWALGSVGAEPVLVWHEQPDLPDVGAVGANELVAHERSEPGRDLCLLRAERLDGAAVEDLAFDRASLEHVSLGGLELVEARCEQRVKRWRHDNLA